jgi:hypothetical protein
LSSDEKWEDEETPNILQKILKKLIPPKKPKVPKEPKVVKNKHKKLNKKGKSEIEPETITKPNTEQLTTEQPISENKVDKKTNGEDKEVWKDDDKPEKKAFVPQLDRQLPGTMVIKRIIATLLILVNILGLVFTSSRNTYSTVVLLLVTFILLDYLAITGKPKTEKWMN